MRVTVVRRIALVQFVEWDPNVWTGEWPERRWQKPEVFYQIAPSGAGLFAWVTVQRKTNPSAKTSFVVREKQELKVLARLGLLWPQSFLCKLQGSKWHLFPKWAKVLGNTTWLKTVKHLYRVHDLFWGKNTSINVYTALYLNCFYGSPFLFLNVQILHHRFTAYTFGTE